MQLKPRDHVLECSGQAGSLLREDLPTRPDFFLNTRVPYEDMWKPGPGNNWGGGTLWQWEW